MLSNIYGRIIEQELKKRLSYEMLANIRKSCRIFNADQNMRLNMS